jgi:hypothetical protein
MDRSAEAIWWIESMTVNIEGLIQELRCAGFAISVADILRIHEVLIELASSSSIPERTKDFAAIISPIICRTARDQSELHSLFSRLDTSQITSDAPLAGAVVMPSKPRERRLVLIPLFLAGMVLAILVIFFASFKFETPQLSNIPIPKFNPGTLLESLKDKHVYVFRFLFSIMPFFLLPVAVFARSRQRMIDRATSFRRVSWAVGGHVDNLVQGASGLSSLRSARSLSLGKIDLKKTVERTAAAAGMTYLVASSQSIDAGYIFLVERLSENDLFFYLMMRLKKRLRQRDIRADIFEFSHNVRICLPVEDPESDSLPVEELNQRFPDRVLIVCTDGGGIFDVAQARLHHWATDLFSAWPIRIVMTPVPSPSWGIRENALQSNGFIVIEAEEERLRQFGSYRDLVAVRGVKTVGRRQIGGSFPPTLERWPLRWLGSIAPSSNTINILVDEVRTFLGNEIFNVLCACALLPVLHPVVALRLANSILSVESSILDQRLLPLARLPWLRYGVIPTWLRVALVERRSKDLDRTIRQSLLSLISLSSDRWIEQISIGALEGVRLRDPSQWQQLGISVSAPSWLPKISGATSPKISSQRGPMVRRLLRSIHEVKWIIVGVVACSIALWFIAGYFEHSSGSSPFDHRSGRVQPTIDGQYVGTAIATNAGSLEGRPCPQGRLGHVTLKIANNRATLVYNPDTHLIFSGPVTEGGDVQLPGRNDSGTPGMYLAGVIANGQFDGSTFGLACNADMHLTRIER